MSSLTKKLLFLWVFSIVCNFTTSDSDECRASVYEVFFERMKPGFYLKYAMFALSEELIKSLGSTQEYVNYYEENKNLVQISHPSFGEKRKQINVYFELFKRPHSLRAALHNIPKETRKKHILGYFKYLVSKLKDDTNGLLDSYAMSPDDFCEKYIEEEPLCREALYKMFNVDGPNENRKMRLLKEIKGHKAFLHCYEKYNYLDFTMANFFPSSSSASNYDRELNYRTQLTIMIAYLMVMMDAAAKLAKDKMTSNPSLFPTIEAYCSGASSSSNLQPEE